MSRFPCRFLSAAVGTVAALLFPAHVAQAQACCAGAAMLSGFRLEESEWAAVALTLSGALVAGQFDRAGSWSRTPSGSVEANLEQSLALLVRAPAWGQLGLVVPVAEAIRRSPGAADAGGGLGDLRLSYRWEPLVPGEHSWVPGLSLTLGASLPTGRPVDRATHLLATDATGLGSIVGRLMLAAEQSHGPWLVQVSGALGWQAPRDVGGVQQRFGPQSAVSLAVGRAFASGWGVALAATSRWDAASTVDGRMEPSSERRLVTLGLTGGGRISGPWRLQASIMAPVTWNGFGRSIPGAPTLTAGVVRSLW